MAEHIQGTDEWLAARLGRPTSSMYSALMAKGEGKTRKAYMLKLAAERLTGKVEEGFSNKHMDRGTEQEPFARMAYEALTGNVVEEVGFITHDTIPTGCSPDGLIDLDGGIEIKSVIPTVQIETILKGGYPTTHKAQIQGNLWNTKRRWWDFVSNSPDLPPGLDLYIYRVERDEEYIKTLEAEVVRFLCELDALVADLSGRKIIESIAPTLTLIAFPESDKTMPDTTTEQDLPANNAEESANLTENNQTQFEDQRGKADDGMGLEQSGRAQPEAASTPPIQTDESAVDDFIRLLSIGVVEKKALRVNILKWEKYRVALLMQQEKAA